MSNYSRTKNSALNIMTGFGGQILSILISFLCRTVFIKTLGVEYLGINGLFSDILSMLSLAELGFDTAISFRLYKPIADKDDNKVRQYLAFFKKVYFVIGGVVLLLGLLFIPFLRYLIADYDSLHDLGINAVLVFILFLVQNVSTYFFFAYRSIVLKVDQKQHVLDIVGYFVTIASGVAKIIVLLVFNNFISYIICGTLFFIFQNIVNAIVATKRYPKYFEDSDSGLTVEERTSLFKDCGALFVYKINAVVMKATDNLVLSASIGIAIVGRYSNYVLIYSAVRAILHSVYQSVKASMGNLFATEDISKKYFFFEVMNFLSIILYGTAAVGIASVSNDLIYLWIGPDYIIPQPFPILLGIEIFLTGLKENLAQIRHVSGAFKQMWFRPVIGSIINVSFSIILVRFWGISGVVVGTILAAIFANLMIDPSVIHKYSFSGFKPVSYYYKKNLLFIFALLLLSVCVVKLCSLFAFESRILQLIIRFILCAITVPISLILLFWNRDECIYLRKKIQSILCRKL